jgi:hypothetical protein
VLHELKNARARARVREALGRAEEGRAWLIARRLMGGAD